jgi:hypothetical protein
LPFPNIHTCLICEDIRPEPGSKFTILGFFGVAPKVEIRIPRLEHANLRLAFLAIADRGDLLEPTDISFSVVDEAGSVLVTSPESPINITRSDSPLATLSLAFGIGGLGILHEGRHDFILSSGGQEVYRTSFLIRLGAPQG